nr:MAG TPA: hypothetical protein [Bacteriophage sp.]
MVLILVPLTSVFCLLSKAICTTLDIGLLISDVLSTFSKPI